MKHLHLVLLTSVVLTGCALTTHDAPNTKDLYFTPSTASDPQIDPVVNPNDYQISNVGVIIKIPLSQEQIRATFDDDGHGLPHNVREYIYTRYKDAPDSNNLIIAMENYVTIRSNILKMVAKGENMKKHVKLFYSAIDNRVCLTKQIKTTLNISDMQANQEVTNLHNMFLKDDTRLQLYLIMNKQVNRTTLHYNYNHIDCTQFENK